MQQHPELLFWDKCPCCGYCEYDAEANSRYPLAHKLFKRNIALEADKALEDSETTLP